MFRIRWFAISYDGPIAIRYPRGEAYRGLKEFLAPVEYGVSEMLYEERGTALLAVGSMVSTAEHIREKLKSAGQPCTLVNGGKIIKWELQGIVKPRLDRLLRNAHAVVRDADETDFPLLFCLEHRLIKTASVSRLRTDCRIVELVNVHVVCF